MKKQTLHSSSEISMVPSDEPKRQGLKTQKALIVLGMHRSGTSALTGALHILGVDLGRNLMPSHPFENRKGFWEHLDIVQAHESLLRWLNLRWDYVGPFPDKWWLEKDAETFRSKIISIIQRDFQASSLWGFKDPRLCRLLPLWEDIFAELEFRPYFIHIVRSPIEVAASLKRRNGFPHEKSFTLWAEHVLEAEEHSRGYPRVFVDYRKLLDHWSDALTNIADVLGLQWPVALIDASEKLDKFLTKQLRHFGNKFNEDLAINTLPDFVSGTYQRLTEACSQGRPDQTGFLDEFRKELDGYVYSWPMLALGADLRSLVADQDNRLGQLSGVIQERDSQITQLQEWVREDDAEIEKLKEQERATETEVSNLQSLIREKESLEAQLRDLVSERDTRINGLTADRDNRLAELAGIIQERDSQITQLQEWAREDDAEIERLKEQLEHTKAMLARMESRILELQGRLQALDDDRETLVGQLESSRISHADAKARLAEREIELSSIYHSTSWRLTAPVRFLGRAVPRSHR